MDTPRISTTGHRPTSPSAPEAFKSPSPADEHHDITGYRDDRLTGFTLAASLVSISLLLLSEIWSVAFASVWAVSGVWHLPLSVTTGIALIVGGGALWTSWQAIRLVIAS